MGHTHITESLLKKPQLERCFIEIVTLAMSIFNCFAEFAL